MVDIDEINEGREACALCEKLGTDYVDGLIVCDDHCELIACECCGLVHLRGIPHDPQCLDCGGCGWVSTNEPCVSYHRMSAADKKLLDAWDSKMARCRAAADQLEE